MNKEKWINMLDLMPHPEGGYYKEVIKSEQTLSDHNALYTSIYFLLEKNNISHFHRIQSDEVWYYHAGQTLTVHMIHPDGKHEQVNVGPHVDKGDVLQALVPKGVIFASTVEGDNDYALVGCMCSPGFQFEKFELFTQDELLEQYPQHEEAIKKYAFESIK
ncbi:cupin domain-containing protein [Mammaliicoccus fleurettii]|uniref:Cupin domain-containing protein n=1 Tax=Mammaliicoccus fleurettii TaxID=150056 RepID=A0ABS5ML72_9STAP|nr:MULTISPECIES: cupin domain-containing protein [Mammaliicoccus]MBL0846311.1 cupin domain-containing protein [Mammaliicoccus fleurettii]MBS3671387.1 cupin domain-containing protein [Mammaliicoccus fleurettii]MBS3696659.1 cupin domain-containing protein [Mammaliicoccus fleurettii]MEB6201090.1 cupin domain-containing protein [Mammaliicoccus fleurettii]